MREIFMETIVLKLSTEEKQLLEFAAFLRNVTVEALSSKQPGAMLKP